jgi:hypothetical protein
VTLKVVFKDSLDDCLSTGFGFFGFSRTLVEISIDIGFYIAILKVLKKEVD